MIPYLQLQLTGLGIIVEETCYGSISPGQPSGSRPSS